MQDRREVFEEVIASDMFRNDNECVDIRSLGLRLAIRDCP